MLVARCVLWAVIAVGSEVSKIRVYAILRAGVKSDGAPLYPSRLYVLRRKTLFRCRFRDAVFVLSYNTLAPPCRFRGVVFVLTSNLLALVVQWQEPRWDRLG